MPGGAHESVEPTEFWFCEVTEVLETDGGLSLMPLSCARKNGYGGQFGLTPRIGRCAISIKKEGTSRSLRGRVPVARWESRCRALGRPFPFIHRFFPPLKTNTHLLLLRFGARVRGLRRQEPLSRGCALPATPDPETQLLIRGDTAVLGAVLGAPRLRRQ